MRHQPLGGVQEDHRHLWSLPITKVTAIDALMLFGNFMFSFWRISQKFLWMIKWVFEKKSKTFCISKDSSLLSRTLILQSKIKNRTFSILKNFISIQLKSSAFNVLEQEASSLRRVRVTTGSLCLDDKKWDLVYYTYYTLSLTIDLCFLEHNYICVYVWYMNDSCHKYWKLLFF